jgi:hypothetical protein
VGGVEGLPSLGSLATNKDTDKKRTRGRKTYFTLPTRLRKSLLDDRTCAAIAFPAASPTPYSMARNTF